EYRPRPRPTRQLRCDRALHSFAIPRYIRLVLDARKRSSFMATVVASTNTRILPSPHALLHRSLLVRSTIIIIRIGLILLALGVGFLAVARWPVTMGAVVKPYSFDLFFALVLILPAVHWLRRPERTGWLALLAALVPIALMGSYPAVFVAGAVSVALLPTVWQ